MAKNRNNKKKRNGVVSMDTTDASVSEQSQGTCFTPLPFTLLLSMLFVEFNNENIQILFLLIFHCNFNYSCFSTLIKPLFSFNFNFLVTTFLVWFKIEFCLTFSNGYIRVRSSKHGFWCYQYVSNELPSQ